jgi:hypothetical protein
MIQVVKAQEKIGLKCVLRHKRAFLIDLLLKIKVQQEIQLLSPMMMSYLGFFLSKSSIHRMHDPVSIVPHIQSKMFTDNHMSQIKYNYYISNVSKDYDNSQQNRTVKYSITSQEWQPGQHVT